MLRRMMTSKGPAPPVVPTELWRQLYETAGRFQRLAPWRWMDDTHLFGVNNEHGVRLVSVLGGMGQVFGLASHRGSTGIHALFRLLNGEVEPENPEVSFEQDAVVMDFTPAHDLRPADRGIIRKIHFQPVAGRGGLFPQFYSHKPGYVPWHINEAEGRAMLDDLDKALLYAELVRRDPKRFNTITRQKLPFLPARTAGPLKAEEVEWQNVAAAPPPLDPPLEFLAAGAGALLQLPQSAGEVWELESFHAHIAIGEAPRPYWAKIALAVHARGGRILASQAGNPRQTMAEVAGQTWMGCARQSGVRPKKVKVRSVNLEQALRPLAVALKTRLERVARLPALEAARRSLEHAFPALP
jgi:hypothetical protein